MSDITDRIEALVKGGATVEVRLSDGITLGPYPVIYAEFTEARLIAFWWAGLDEHEHANPVETWTWDGDLGELTFHCQDNVIVTLGAIWSPDH
ncbi:MAG: hypothetical protein Q8R28_03815, partial [Dehalococcoidia bacterium]|nr:hypothetical protein [Dehalococcoidia bacterium]